MAAARTHREPLSRDRVLATAVTLADTDGLAALTMRRLAAELGVEAMSLYHHLPGKEALLGGVIDAVLAEVRAAVDRCGGSAGDVGEDGAGDWRARLRAWFLAARQVMLRHPWAPALMAAQRTVPPGLYGYYDAIIGTLAGAGFSYRLAHRALHAFGSMPLGFVQEVFGPEAGSGGAGTEAELTAMAATLPHLVAMIATESHGADNPELGWCDSQVEFEFTLNLLLDGLERLRGRG